MGNGIAKVIIDFFRKKEKKNKAELSGECDYVRKESNTNTSGGFSSEVRDDGITEERPLQKMLTNFFAQLSCCSDGSTICFFYQESESDAFQIVKLMSTFADINVPFMPLFIDDNAKFIVSIYDRKNYDYIFMMNLALNKAKCKTPLFLYGVKIDKILSGLDCMPCKEDNSDEVVRAIEKIRNTGYFMDDWEIQNFLQEKYSPLFLDHENRRCMYCSYGFSLNSHRYEMIYDNTVNALKKQGFFAVKWVNEYNLFVLVQSYFPSAIYQYRAAWLGRQSLDVYVPEIRVAFEYQGEQHYRAVEYFGSEDKFRVRVHNDEEKRRKCREANVRLVEWPYTEDVNPTNLEFFLKKVNVDVPLRRKEKVTGGLPSSIMQSLTDELTNLPTDGEPFETMSRAIEQKNLYVVALVMLRLLDYGKKRAVEDFFSLALDRFSRKELEKLLQFAYENECQQHDLFSVIASSDRLVSYYLDGYRINFITRRLIIKMVSIGISEEKVVEYIKIWMKNYNSSDFGYIWHLCNEASDYNIQRDQLERILKKAGVKRPRR